jgi:hypothetical protein
VIFDLLPRPTSLMHISQITYSGPSAIHKESELDGSDLVCQGMLMIPLGVHSVSTFGGSIDNKRALTQFKILLLKIRHNFLGDKN